MALFSHEIKTGGKFTCAMPSDRVYLLVFESQPVNQLTPDFVEAFRYSLSKIEAFPKGVVITASRIPEFYSNGISPHAPQDTLERHEEHLSPLLRQLLRCSMPTITLISGQAVGNGFLLALCHNFRIQNSRGSSLCLHEGRSTPVLSKWMIDFVNAKLFAAKLTRSIIAGESMRARDAVRSGLVDKVGSFKDALRLIEKERLLDAGTRYGYCGKKELSNRNAIIMLDARNGGEIKFHRL